MKCTSQSDHPSDSKIIQNVLAPQSHLKNAELSLCPHASHIPHSRIVAFSFAKESRRHFPCHFPLTANLPLTAAGL
jgi:hypothetical protein